MSGPSPREWTLAGLAVIVAGGVWLVATGTREDRTSPALPPPLPVRNRIMPETAVLIECESPVEPARVWQSRADDAASGGACLELPEGTGKPPQIDVPVRYEAPVMEAGRYRTWLRAWWQDSCGNSLSIRVGDSPPETVGQDAVYWRWHWVPAHALVALQPGPVEVEIGNREDGVRIDQILLCPDPEFVPQGPAGHADTPLPVPYFMDDFLRSPGTPNPGWEWDESLFSLESSLDPNGLPLQATLLASSTEPAEALIGQPQWQDYRTAVSFRLEDAGSATLLSHVSRASGVMLSCVRGRGDGAGAARWTLSYQARGERQELAACVLAVRPAVWYRMELRVNGRRAWAFLDGERILRTVLPAACVGRAGLGASGGRVRFDDFGVTPRAEAVAPRPLEMHAFTSDKAVRSVLDDFTDEELREMAQGADADLLERREVLYDLIAPDRQHARFSPAGGYWSVRDGVLTALATGPGANLMRNRPLAGDLEARFRLSLVSDGAAGGLVFEGDMTPAGNRVLIGEHAVELWREGAGTPESKPVTTPRETWIEGIVRRERDRIGVWLDGCLVAQFEGVARGSGLGLGLSARGKARFDDVALACLRTPGSRLYPFDRSETDWMSAGDGWEQHTGITCKDASHWVTCRAGDQGAALWHKRRTRSERMSLAAEVFEHSVWYGWSKSPTHEHFLYAGLGLLISSDGTGLRSGYAAVVNPAGIGPTALLRDGHCVARAPEHLMPMVHRGGHSPVRPRGSVICLRRNGPDVEVIVNDVTVISWRDPEPLGGDHTALFAAPGISNWSDISVVGEKDIGPARFWPGGGPPNDVTELLRAVR